MEGDYFSEWLPRFSHHLKMRNYSPRTIASYERVIRKFAHYLWISRNKGVEKLVIYWKDLAHGRMDTDVDITPIQNAASNHIVPVVLLPVSLCAGGNRGKSSGCGRSSEN